MAPLLDGGLRDAGERLAVGLGESREVADDEDLRMARDREVGSDRDASRAVERHAERARERGREDAGRPEDRPGGDPLAAHDDGVGSDVGHGGALADLDAHAARAAPRAFARELLGKGREDARPGLDEDDARVPRVDRPEVEHEHVPRDLGDRPGELDAGRAAADEDERQQRAAPRGIGLALGLLEGEEDPAADLDARPRAS